MKTNDYLLAMATAAFSYLYYEQNAGINFLIFNLLFIAITLYRDPKLISENKWRWGAAMCLLSSVGIFMNSTALAIISNCFSLLLLSAFSFRKQTSAAFSFLFSFYSVVISAAVIVDGLMRPAREKPEKSAAGNILYKIIGISAVFLLTAVFLGLYREINPLFAVNTQWINLKFISFSWIVFTTFGFLIVYGLYHHRTIAVVESWENNLPLVNLQGENISSVKFETERFAGLLLFAILNTMLLILNYGDIQTLWLGGSLPDGINHSDFVRQGVEVIIFSIVIAAGLIMFLFRRDFASQKNNKIIKMLVCLWIFQTFIMLISTASRNHLYITEFGLTALRIGVYVWLMLAVIGLALTTDKVLKERSNWYLIKTNVAVWFTILSISSLFNWDVLITRYNISHQPLASVDFEYLFELSEANLPELIAVTKRSDFRQIKSKPIRHNNDAVYHYYLTRKIKGYLNEYTNDWQSYDLRDQRIITSLRNY